MSVQIVKPTDPVILLCCAIATQEGWFSPGTIPVVRNNPGDLRFAKQLNASAPGWNGQGVAPIATFTTPETGITGIFRDVWAKVAQGLTVAQIISVWAPPNENDTSTYLQNVLDWTGLKSDMPMLQQIAALVKLN